MSKKFILLATVATIVISGCSQKPDSEEPQTVEEAKVVVVEPAVVTESEIVEPIIEIEPDVPTKPVDYSDVAYEITEKGYPKTYARWGKDWMDDINRMMPLAVARVATNPKCDAPELADLSDNRSSPQQEAVFYVDCKNKERFYISQSELSGTSEVQAESSVLAGKPSQYIQPCRDMTIPQLAYPSTFDENFAGANSYQGTSGNMVVEIDFTAKNAMGIELPQAVRCVFSTNGDVEAVIMNR